MHTPKKRSIWLLPVVAVSFLQLTACKRESSADAPITGQTQTVTQAPGGMTPMVNPAPAPSGPLKYALIYKAPGWAGIAVMNGIPVTLFGGMDGAIPVTEWTQNGDNEVWVVAQAAEGTKDPMQFQIASSVSDNYSNLRPEAPPGTIPVPDKTGLMRAAVHFKSNNTAEFVWQKAATVDPLSTEDQKAITDYCEKFLQAFRDKNRDAVLELSTTVSSIKAKSMGISMDQAKANDSKLLDDVFANAADIKVIDKTGIQVRTLPRGVIVFPSKVDGVTHLVSITDKTDPKRSLNFDAVVLCKIDGQWIRVN